MKPILEVDHVGKKYRISHRAGPYLSFRERLWHTFSFDKTEAEDFWALREVSFSVMPGESMGIIGRNGAGKSTLLKILSKITPPTTGRIVSRGRIASLLEVGTGFHPELTGRENVFLNGSLLGMKRKEIEQKFDEIVAFSGVEKFLDTPLKHYSSGMQLRLAFAVAAFLEPEILIIDEVLAVGDAEFQKKCLGKMEDVSKSGRTILFVSHNMAAVENLCDRAVLLEGGQHIFAGPVADVIEQYNSRNLVSQTEIKLPKPLDAHAWLDTLTFADRQEPVYYFGESIVLRATYVSEKEIHPCLGMVVSSIDGTKLINANNRYQKDGQETFRGTTGTITCQLGAVPLMEGKYTVSLFFGDEKSDTHIIEQAATFEVKERDLWGTKKTPPRKASYLWWPVQFTLTN
ncbi:MAG: ABC transporter ATP-binding protein [Cyclobacteriaceae bacterium]|jgi:lipopolysaccharide transport system ATP-binding protein|nr:ABC transporter ATP-binding protein [Cyclobacteriaceae bacterium]